MARSLGGTKPKEAKGSGPFFFVGGRNGAPIVTAYCESKGWHRLYDKRRNDYILKWCEIKSKIAYNSFREGQQLLYQIPNNSVLTTKIGLLNSLRAFDRVNSKLPQGCGLRKLKMEDFIPETSRMDVRDEQEAFFAQLEAQSIPWICKPTGLNQGQGIFLLRTEEDIRVFQIQLQSLKDHQTSRKSYHQQPYIVQRYIQNPLLLKGRKFDVRSYLLIACTTPYIVFFRHGYVRLTCDIYDPNSSNLSTHLTNQYIQKKHPQYKVFKEDTVWSMESLNVHLNQHHCQDKALSQDWVFGAFTKRMQQIVMQCFMAVKNKLNRKLGYFDLIGCDFLIDEDFKVWLLEMNCNPALHSSCRVLKETVPAAVFETLDITLEIFNKCRCGLPVFPLSSQREFVLLYSGEDKPALPPGSNVRGPALPQGSNVRGPALPKGSNARGPALPQGSNVRGPALPQGSNAQGPALPQGSNMRGPALRHVGHPGRTPRREAGLRRPAMVQHNQAEKTLKLPQHCIKMPPNAKTTSTDKSTVISRPVPTFSMASHSTTQHWKSKPHLLSKSHSKLAQVQQHSQVKLNARVIISRIHNHLLADQRPEQYRFAPKKSTIDCIPALRVVIKCNHLFEP
ncbi:protein polyglycylase TTLL10 [Paramormyrops kingsleyae]|uniref:protein polyglycylase TTLL10 n=1 Tax=Paramormyrops kingsleyae TaxID=1676925 RepID=UPI000CD5F744|nr:inactive polyglycylase TTLL10 [Paramormyrops kingsleyae]